jgi:hypothetical protein
VTHNAGERAEHPARLRRGEEAGVRWRRQRHQGDRITVFTISFFAPDAAQTLMEQCASSTAHHFRIQNLNIDAAFQAIAKTINQLRLTL